MTGPNTYYYPVTGRSSTGDVFDRIPIEDMQQNHPRQFTLFVLAYAEVQRVDFSSFGVEAEAYWQIASIHGKPYTEYAGDRKSPEEKEGDFDHKDPKDTLPTPSRFGGMHSTSRQVSLLKCECIRLLQVCRFQWAV